MVKVEELEPVTASDRGVATDGVILVGNPNDDDDVESFSGVGLVTNSILFCWLFTINDNKKRQVCSKTHDQGLHKSKLFLVVCPETSAPVATHLTVFLYVLVSL